MIPASRPVSGSLIRQPDFVRLWAGQTISAFGTQVTILAVPVVAAVSLRVSPLEFALLGTLEFLPFVLLGLPAGAWVDRVRRRPILIAADLGRAVALLTIPVVALLDVLTIWQLFLVVFLNGCLSVFFDVAYQTHLPAIVGPDQLVEGNAKLELTRTASQRLGPGLAGLLVGLVTAPIAVVVDAASYVASALCLAAIRRPEPAPPPPHDDAARRPSMRRDIWAGVRFVTGEPVLRALAASVAIGYLFGMIADSIIILHLVTERGMRPELIGLAFTLGSIGVFGGALAANRLTTRIGVGRVILVAGVGEAVSWLPVAFAPDTLLFAAFSATIIALSFFGALWNVNAMSIRQAITPPGMRGRMNATMRFVSWGTIPVATLVGGLLGGAIGLHSTIVVGAVGNLAVFLPIALSPLPAIRSMPAGDGSEAEPQLTG